MPSPEAGRGPLDLLGRLLSLMGVLSALAALTTVYYMLRPVDDVTGLGWLGSVALQLAPQLLAPALAAAGLALLSRKLGARIATGAFGLVAVTTTVMACWVTTASLRRAWQYGVRPSIGAIVVPRISGGGPQPDKAVTYATAPDGTRLLLDVWPARNLREGGPRPAIVKVHGGGWCHGARSQLAVWNRWLNDLGYAVFDADYRMPPPARWQDEVADVKCAIGWLAANAGTYAIDADRISLLGYSAGGNLALLAAYSMGDARLPPSCPVPAVPIRSVVNLYGPADMALLYSASGSPAYVRPLMESYVGGSPAAFADRYALLSPLSHVGRGTPPTITLQGEADRVVPAEQARLLDRALAAAGVAHETYLFPWSDHGFDAVVGSLAAQTARAKVADFLARHGGGH